MFAVTRVFRDIQNGHLCLALALPRSSHREPKLFGPIGVRVFGVNVFGVKTL